MHSSWQAAGCAADQQSGVALEPGEAGPPRNQQRGRRPLVFMSVQAANHGLTQWSILVPEGSVADREPAAESGGHSPSSKQTLVKLVAHPARSILHALNHMSHTLAKIFIAQFRVRTDKCKIGLLSPCTPAKMQK